MVFNVSLSDIVVLLVTEKGITRENQQPAQVTDKYYHISSTPRRLRRIRTHSVSGDRNFSYRMHHHSTNPYRDS